MIPYTVIDGGVTTPEDPWLLKFEAQDGHTDYGLASEEDELHSLYQAGGSPYTVTIWSQCEDDPDWLR